MKLLLPAPDAIRTDPLTLLTACSGNTRVPGGSSHNNMRAALHWLLVVSALARVDGQACPVDGTCEDSCAALTESESDDCECVVPVSLTSHDPFTPWRPAMCATLPKEKTEVPQDPPRRTTF